MRDLSFRSIREGASRVGCRGLVNASLFSVDLMIRIKPFRLVSGRITDRDNQGEVTVFPGSDYQRA